MYTRQNIQSLIPLHLRKRLQFALCCWQIYTCAASFCISCGAEVQNILNVNQTNAINTQNPIKIFENPYETKFIGSFLSGPFQTSRNDFIRFLVNMLLTYWNRNLTNAPMNSNINDPQNIFEKFKFPNEQRNSSCIS